MLIINQDGGEYTKLPELNVAVGLIEELLGASVDDTTFTVENESGAVLASASNRRIIGTFTKQQWGGRKNDTAMFVGNEAFDATNAILLMPHEKLIFLQDNSEESDSIGQDHIQWNGPCEVSITDSVCEFFGVGETESITKENLAYVRNRFNPQPATEEIVTLSVKLKLKVIPGASVQEFIDNLDYSFISASAGVTVVNSEIVESEHQQ
jgi:hypothetical protein